MDTFQHIPLDRNKECIRLLRFVDQRPSSKLDHFALEMHDIATAPRFLALSYTWGSFKPTRNIVVDGSILSIGENLWVALKALRSFFPNNAAILEKPMPWKNSQTTTTKDLLQENGYPLIWVDAVCINQSDNLEKNHQVNMMGSIFSQANCVISWPGDEADDSGLLMKAIRATTHARQYASVEVKQAMEAFVKRPYWRRMWIIQEFVLPPNLIILCGHEAAWSEELFHFWHDEKPMSGADGSNLYFKGRSVAHSQKSGLAALILLRGSRHDGFQPGGDRRITIWNLNSPSPSAWLFSVHRIMTRLTYGECRDPRDRIYALLTLIGPREGVEPLLADYEISAEDLYYRFLGYLGPPSGANAWEQLRKRLRVALDSSSWADAEATKLHEVVYRIVGMVYGHAMDCDYYELFRQVEKVLAGHLEQPLEGMLCEGDIFYQDLIQRFQAFPREEDPRTWRLFDNFLLLWLKILPLDDDFSDDDISSRVLSPSSSAMSLSILSDDDLSFDSSAPGSPRPYDR